MPAAARAVDDKVRLWRGANPKLVHGSRKRSCFVTVGLNWEQHRSKPDAPARALLLAIERDPEVMRKLLVDMADRLAELLSPERGAACNAAACRVKILKSRHFLAKGGDLCFTFTEGCGGECTGKGLGRRGMLVGWKKRRKALKSLKTAMGIGACCPVSTPRGLGSSRRKALKKQRFRRPGSWMPAFAVMTTIERLGSRVASTERAA
jgi:hypothetical protein